MSLRFFSNQSLASHIVGGIALLTLILAVFTNHFFRQYLLDDLTASTRDRAANTLNALSTSLLDDLITEDIPRLNTFVDQLMQPGSEYVFIEIFNEQGQRLSHHDRRSLLASNNRQNVHDNVLSYSKEIELEGEFFGSIKIGRDLQGEFQRIDKLVNHAVIIVIVGMLVLTGLILMLLHVWVISPLRKINQRVQGLSDGQLDDQLVLRSSRDMSLLANSINNHAAALKQQQQSQIQLQQARDKAEKASRAKTDFLSSMSHELRTPLNAILGFAQIMKLDEKLDSSQTEMLDEINISGELLLSHVNQVLDLSKIESGRVVVSPIRLDAGQLITQVCEHLQPMANRYQVSLHNEMTDNYPVYADPKRLRQVFLNLVSNAIKYNQAGGEVRLSATQIKHQLVIRVSDNGQGISAELREELFEPFNQLAVYDASINGLGIGLAISKNLLDLMQGSIECWSEPGVGSVFTVSLPCQH